MKFFYAKLSIVFVCRPISHIKIQLSSRERFATVVARAT